MEKLCSTTRNHCTFQLPTKNAKLYLNAVNAAGKSNPMKVIIFPKGRTLILHNYHKKMIWLISFFCFCKMPAMCFISVSQSQTVLSNVSVTPHDDRSLMVRWRSVVSSDLKGFTVEWRPLLDTDISLTQFEMTDRNQTSLVLKGILNGVFFSISLPLYKKACYCSA